MNIFQKIKIFFQRGFNGYSDYDLINFDDYIAGVLKSGIKEMIKYMNSSPDKYESLEEYTKILKKLVTGLEIYIKNEWKTLEDLDALNQSNRETLELLIQEFEGLWL